MEMQEIMNRIECCMELEGRKDVEFRALISLTELGDIVKYITHDSELNPGARPHGTPRDEALAYGQAIVQTLATLLLRGIDVEEAIELGLKNWEDADWRRREAKKIAEANGVRTLIGIGVVAGTISGMIYHLDEHRDGDLPSGSIVVTKFAKPDLVVHFHKIVAIITDHGGGTCHAANIARERGIISAVGTGNATEVLKHGEHIILHIPREGHGAAIEARMSS